MEIRIYDRDLDFKGIIENQTSFIWNRKYNETGSFEIHAPMTTQNMELLQMENIISYRGAKEAGIIEELELFETNEMHEIVCSGRFLDSYMDRRLIKGTLKYSGTIENAMRKILSEATPLPHVVLGSTKGFTERVEFQATYKELLSYEQKLAKIGAFGYRFIPDFTAKTITFDIYKGVDRSYSQVERHRIEFSDRYENIYQAEYKENSVLFKNVAYVGGEGEGSERVFVQTGETSSTGYDRYETFVDARDLNSEDMTESAYKQTLMTRGQEVLNNHIYSSTFGCSVIATGNFEYKKDYDVGDIVTVKKSDWNLSTNLRITEASEVYEHEIAIVSLTFGDPLPEKLDLED